MILVVLMYAILASTFIFAKQVVATANPYFIIGVRMILAGSILLGYYWFFKPNLLKIKRSDWGTFFSATLFHIYFAFLLEFWALQHVSALKTTVIYTSTPFIAAIMAYFLLKERLTKQKVLGIVIGLGGLLPIILTQAVSEGESYREFLSISVPEGVLFLAVISATYAWFVVSKLMSRGYSFGVINGVAMLVGGILATITNLLINGFTNPIYDGWGFVIWLAALIITANLAFYNLYGYLLQTYSITFLTFSGFLSPCFGTLYDWLFMSGELYWQYLLALVLITLGLFIFYKDELKKVTL